MDTAIHTLPMIPRQEVIDCTLKAYGTNITRDPLPVIEYLKGVADDLRDLGFPVEQIPNLPQL